VGSTINHHNNSNNVVHIHQQLTGENIHPHSHQTNNHILAHLSFLYFHPSFHPLFCFHRPYQLRFVWTSKWLTAKRGLNQNTQKVRGP
jgi:hypothetical protein